MNYKYYQMKYVSDNFYSKYVFFFINVRKKRRLPQFTEKILYPKAITWLLSTV